MNAAHPPRELLADFAAEVLDSGPAQQVEAHVIACPLCAEQLGEAERMRSLLIVRDDPGPMPQVIWDRMLKAIDDERAIIRTGELPAFFPPPAAPDTTGLLPSWETSPLGSWEPATGQVETPTTITPTPASQPEVERYEAASPTEATNPYVNDSAPGSLFVVSDPVDPQRYHAESALPDVPTSGELAATNLSTAPEESTQRTRRNVRNDNATSKSLTRFVRPLGLAAAVIGMVTLAGVASMRLFATVGSGSATSAAASGGVPISAQSREGAYAAIIQHSDTDYVKASMARQVRALAVDGTAGPVAAPAAAATGTTPSPSVSAAASLSDQTAVTGTSSTAALAGSAQAPASPDISDPVRLQQCLDSLDAGSDNPIAIDLARYEGKDAAIIVLPGRDGGYEAWVVARSCSREAPGLIDFYSVPAS